jgi:hypothetical protein
MVNYIISDSYRQFYAIGYGITGVIGPILWLRERLGVISQRRGHLAWSNV